MSNTSKKNYELDIRIAGKMDPSVSEVMKKLSDMMRETQDRVAKETQLSWADTIRGVAPLFDALDDIGDKAIKSIQMGAVATFTAVRPQIEKAISIGREFEQQMANVEAISEVPLDQMAAITEKARELGRATIFTAQQVGEGMEYMALAGWDSDQIQDGIDGIISLAAASGEDLSRVSEIMADSLAAFKMNASDAEKMADILAATALNSNTNVAKLGDSFTYVAPVAGAFGFTAEDTALALGLLANNGVKASKAGTSLRTLFTKFASDIKIVGDGIGEVVVQTTKDGKVRSLIDIITDLRAAFAGLSEDEQIANAKDIGGLRGMTGLLAIINSPQDVIDKLYGKILSADDANSASRAADVRLDTLSGDLEKFNDALSDVYLTIYESTGGPMREGVQWFTDLINSLNGYLMDGDLSGATAGVKTVTSYLDGILSFANGLKPAAVSGFQAVVKALPAMAGALIALKTSTTLFKGVGMLSTLKFMMPYLIGGAPLIAGLLGVGVAVGTITSALIYYKKAELDLMNENLASHFGQIALSAKELEAVAGRIVGRNGFVGLLESLNEFGKLDAISDTISTALETLNKYNFKVSIGLELDADEQERYKESIDAYVRSMNEYALQQQYAVNLNLKFLLSDYDITGGSITEKINTYYSGLSSALSELGTDLGKTVNEAFNDNILTIDEVNAISKIQQQMAEIQAKMATSEFEASLQLLGEKYGYGSLTAGSFASLIDEVNKQQSELDTALSESETKARASIISAYNGGAISNDEYEYLLYMSRYSALNSRADMFTRSADTLLGTIGNVYGTEVSSYKNQIDEILKLFSSPEYASQWAFNPLGAFLSMQDSIDSAPKSTRDAINSMLKDIEPTVDQIASYKQSYEELGMQIPEGIAEGISKTLEEYTILKALAGDKEALAGLLATYMKSDEDYSDLFKTEDLLGVKSIADGYEYAFNDVITPAIEKSFDIAKLILDTTYSRGFVVTPDLRIDINPSLTESAVSFLNRQIGIGKHSDGGYIGSKQLSWLGEAGPEMVVPLDGTPNAFNLWKRAGDILSNKSGSGAGTPSIVYSPNITINGNASRDDVLSANRQAQEEFDERMNNWLKQNRRISFV